ncbi:alpha-2 adrenergic receptor [Trichonephila clavipes]|uniref:Alpha-2 adrenergic receptor n=1 Tax=Trichonephila clavipes TaxID=2585209 RepID=A0A8X6VU99_TRICX|nr:alpha-2 adrenergic receptor [Trichonephila clavipes]
MKIGNNGNLVLGPFDESTPCLMIVLMNCQTKLRINHLTAIKSVAILETDAGYFMGVRNVRRDPSPRWGENYRRCEEAHFWLNGYVNKQNCRIWSEANPQVYVETPLHPEKLTVWCALWAGGILLQK